LSDPKVSVIIVNFNSLPLISECISSISDNTSIDHEIIVVSNSDESRSEIDSFLKKNPSVNFSATGSNLGFAKANNIGAKKASGEYLFFLNPDTLLINEAIDLLYQKIKTSSDIGLLGPAIFDSSGTPEPSIVAHISVLSLISLAFPFLYLFISQKSRGAFYSLEEPGYVDVVHGSSMFIPSKLYEEVGGMDEDFFLYSEERDLCLKVAQCNYKVFYFNEAKVEHMGGGASENLFLPLEIEKHRSKKKLIKKYYPNLVFLNRLCGIIGYGTRSVIKALSFDKVKTKQFTTLFNWYLFKYK
jgi:hypothetical protein